MAVELDGNVRMRGDTGPGVDVSVFADGGRLRLVCGNELVGEWPVAEIGVYAFQEGFVVRVQGEEFLLRTADDVAFAEELNVGAASPIMARRLATRRNRQTRPSPPGGEGSPAPSTLAAIGFAVAGALVVLGGTLLNVTQGVSNMTESNLWLAFVIGGVLIIGVAYVMSIGATGARWIGMGALLLVVVVFGLAVSGSPANARRLTAFGFIAGGLVVGIAVLFSGSVAPPE